MAPAGHLSTQKQFKFGAASRREIVFAFARFIFNFTLDTETFLASGLYLDKAGASPESIIGNFSRDDFSI